MKKNFLSSSEKEIIKNISLQYRPWVKSLTSKELLLIKKYILNSNDQFKPNRFFECLNKAMRGEYYKSDLHKLCMYGNIISNAISRQPVSVPLVCYRGVDDDFLSKVEIGDIFSFNQFISTSVIERCALRKKFKYVIIIPTGAKGAYIEDVSLFRGQYEFLLDKSCTYKLIAKSGHNIILEVVV